MSESEQLAEQTCAREAEAVEQHGCGVWSDRVSGVALRLGIVRYDTEGSYRTDSSRDTSFPENEIEVVEKAWQSYLCRSPLDKERALLDALVRNTENEFFRGPTLLELKPFDSFGCGTGPASRMDLPKIRRGVLDLLAGLEANVWYEMRDFVEVVHALAPQLILAPATRGPAVASGQRLRDWEREARFGSKSKKPLPKPEITPEDLYVNFREYEAREDGRVENRPSSTPQCPTLSGESKAATWSGSCARSLISAGWRTWPFGLPSTITGWTSSLRSSASGPSAWHRVFSESGMETSS
ncbi:MAG: hypothetical protein HY303_08155 [Candidatus Wallbacteria bacterium]|nr:hypothetical protein [Candidatus Wallbacteria bacterium]